MTKDLSFSAAISRRFTLLQASFFPVFFLIEGLYSEMMHSFGYGDAFIGVMLSAMGLSCFILQPMMGFLADKTLNYRAIFTVILGVTAFMMPTFFAFYSSRAVVLIYSTVSLGSIKTLFSLMDSWISKVQKQGVDIDYGRLRSVGSIAYAFAAVSLSQLLNLWGYSFMKYLYWFFLVLMLTAVFRLPNPERFSEEKVSLRLSAGVILRNRNFLALVLCGFLMSLCNSSMLSFYSRFISELGGNVGIIGVGYFVMAFSEFFVIRNFTKIANRLGTARVYLLGMLGMGIKALLFSLCQSVPAALLATLAQTFSYAIIIPGAVRYISEQIPREYLASALIIYEACCLSLAQIIGSSMFGAVAEAYSVRTMFAVFSLPCFVGAAAFALYWRAQRLKARASLSTGQEEAASETGSGEAP
ncbi:MAG: MFS transporter [Oscillospiraceae bacterium]|nr:MFS transporter [Oscillospiraceae bacterium]